MTIATIAFLCFIIALTNDANKNVGTVAAILALFALGTLFFGLLFKWPSLIHNSPSHILRTLAMFFIAFSFVLLTFSIYDVNKMILSERQAQNTSYAAIVMAAISFVLALVVSILWSINRFRQTTFAKIHNFGQDKKIKK